MPGYRGFTHSRPLITVVVIGHLPQSKCCFCFVPRACHRLLDLRYCPRDLALSAPPGHCFAGAACACSTAWLWSVSSAGAVRRSAGAPAPASPAQCSHSDSRSCYGASGTIRFAGGAAPSPHCVAAQQNPPSSIKTVVNSGLRFRPSG